MQAPARGVEHAFVPGLALNRAFYWRVVRPLLDAHFPKLRHSAALVGDGSDVLGFDNARSMDHNWGPRGALFLSERDHKRHAGQISAMLKRELPYQFMGFSTNFTKPREIYLVQQMRRIRRGPVNHLVRVWTIRSFFEHYLGFNPAHRITTADWLTFPQQALLEVTGGEVFHDGLGKLKKVRASFAQYPRDIWLYVLYCQWTRIANELSYQARSGEAGDEIGSRVLAGRMIEEIMKLCFIMERRYVPYSKWLGTGFSKLESAHMQLPILLRAIRTDTWQERQRWLGESYRLLGAQHNALGITPKLSTALSDFHGRGYTVLDVGKYMHAIKAQIRNPRLRNLKYELGAIDQFVSHAQITRVNYVHRFLKAIIQ
jgi:hypothetical protein